MGADEKNISTVINRQMTIDAHQHFWRYKAEQHGWINDAMAVIRRDFLPEHLAPLLNAHAIDGCVAVQADETEAETHLLVSMAAAHPFVKAVVGYTDLTAANVVERLHYFNQYNIVKGFRHVLQGLEPAYMLQPSFLNGIAALQQFGFTYDILIYPNHLEAACELVRKNPYQPFVVDHLAKPYIKAGLINEWKTAIEKLAAFDNVHCKISGMVTEADYQHWKTPDFTPYLDAVTAAFGTKRLLFGSDWPVCLVAASYGSMKAIADKYYASFSRNETDDIFGNNAVRFYNI